MLIRLHPKKVYKLVPFTNKFIIHRIRKLVWNIRDNVLKEKDIEKELTNFKEKIVKIRDSLKKIINKEKVDPVTIEHAKDLREKLIRLAVMFREKSKVIIDVFIKEIKEIEGIDDREEVLEFREVKELKKAEQRITKILSDLRKDVLKTVSDEQKAEARAKIDSAMITVRRKTGELNGRIYSILSSLYDYAKREKIGGIVAAAVNTKSEPILLKSVKTETKAAGDLIAQQKQIIKKVENSINLDDFMENITALFDLYLEEAEKLQNAINNIRIFTYNLIKDLHRVGKIISIGEKVDRVLLNDADKTLKNTLDHIERQYRLLFHEAESKLAA